MSRIFYAFLIIVVAVILWMLPFTEAIYDFRTDVRTDIFTVITGVGVTTGSVQLFTDIYDDDTSTIDLSSDDTGDDPTYSSYNASNRQLDMTGFAANATRILTVLYDIDALTESEAVGNLLDILDLFWLLVIIGFPAAGLVAIFVMKA